MRKYLLNPSVLSAVASIVPAVKETQRATSTLRIVATWLVFAGSLALAISGVREQAASARNDAERQELG